MSDSTVFFVCTKTDPYRPEWKDKTTHHPDAVSTGECSDGCCDYWHCPNCDLHFKTEVGQ